MRLFSLIYGIGIVVTIFLSNDAAAVVLTPADVRTSRTPRSVDPMRTPPRLGGRKPARAV